MSEPQIIDATGYRCPLPVLLMEKALRSLPRGARLKIVADDPLAAVDIPHFCREAGHLAEKIPSDPAVCVFLVTAKGNKGG